MQKEKAILLINNYFNIMNKELRNNEPINLGVFFLLPPLIISLMILKFIMYFSKP